MTELPTFKDAHHSLTFKQKHSWMYFIFFPAIAVLLGWGLRGFIGGGPYGGMIPGAMVTMVICLLLDVPLAVAAIAIVFGTTGTAMGGEMTYGQTIGFLRSADTMWWGFAGTSLKGGIWGLNSGLFIALGLVHQKIKVKTIMTGFLIFLIAFVIGLKLINDPKILYFSDPVNQPRNETWAGILFGTAALLIYLKLQAGAKQFRVVLRFAIYGAIGGTLGFGLGSLWITVGSIFGAQFFVLDWWKMMEFTFGFLLGGSLGLATWKTRHMNFNGTQPAALNINKSVSIELIAFLVIGFFIFATMELFNSYLESINNRDEIFYIALSEIGRVIVSYLFIGALLIVIALHFPYLAFQIAITITFTHCMIDLVTDENLFPSLQSSPVLMLATLIFTSLAVGGLVAIFQRKPLVLRSMFLILVWSTIAVAVVRLIIGDEFNFKPHHSTAQIIIGDMFVFNVFIVSAIAVTIMIFKNRSSPLPLTE